MTHSGADVDANTNDLTVTLNHAPETPGTPTYNTPASSPGTVNRPTFTVGGVKAGDAVKLYTDNTCSTEAASGVVAASATSIDLQITNALAEGTYSFYANAINSQGFPSGCTSTSITYAFEPPNCPAEYAVVPANPSLGVNSDFCVAKYEMKNVGGVATSQASGALWVSIDAPSAWNACNALGTGYALISNPEWMTIARNVENESSNWSGSTVGSGAMYLGHADSSPNSALAVTNTADPYDSTGNSSAQAMGSGKEQKRTYVLSNAEEVWDLSGNVWEWTDWSSADGGFTTGPTSCLGGWQELNAVSCGALAADSYMPSNSTFTSTHNIGRFYGGSGGAAVRGGSYSNGTDSGAFTLHVALGPSDSNNVVGFRCVFRP